MALGHHEQDGECGATIIYGNTADISHIADFGFYDWCWFWSPKESSQDRQQLGRWIGPSFDVGDVLCFAVLSSNGMVMHRSSVFPLTVEERNSQSVRDMKRDFTENLKSKLGDRMKGISPGSNDENDKFVRPQRPKEETPEFEMYQDEEAPDSDDERAPVTEEENQLEFDRYVSARVQLHEGDVSKYGTVKG